MRPSVPDDVNVTGNNLQVSVNTKLLMSLVKNIVGPFPLKLNILTLKKIITYKSSRFCLRSYQDQFKVRGSGSSGKRKS